MSRKRFNFSVENLGTREALGWYGVGETLEAAWKAAALVLPACALVLYRFEIENTLTREQTRIIGQGATLAEAWKDAMSLTRETFRPKNDGKSREQMGLALLLPPRAGDTFALGRAVSRSVESFQSDETFAQEQTRKRIEAAQRAEEAARYAA